MQKLRSMVRVTNPAYPLAALLSLVLTQVSADHHTLSDEQSCYVQVQGRVAWDYTGNRNWGEQNLIELCRGTRRPAEPARCFEQAMHGGINWGGGTRWEWRYALDLCRGTSDADWTISCFTESLREGYDGDAAIARCAGTQRPQNQRFDNERFDDPIYPANPNRRVEQRDRFRDERLRAPNAPRNELSCYDHLQGRVAWNYDGDRNWSEDNIRQLCDGSRFPAEPARCFEQAMHGGINWGGDTRWEWENALALCRGSEDARGTLGCFEDAVRSGLSWQRAIPRCASRR